MNPLESSVCAAVVRRLQQLGVPASEIGVITPYDSHKRLLKRAIHGMEGGIVSRRVAFLSQLDLLELEPHPHVLTVDGFQGSERDFIVFSAVRSNLQASLGFLKDERRMCVALSRCKRGEAPLTTNTQHTSVLEMYVCLSGRRLSVSVDNGGRLQDTQLTPHLAGVGGVRGLAGLPGVLRHLHEAAPPSTPHTRAGIDECVQE